MSAGLRRSYANWALILVVGLPPFCTGYILSHFCPRSIDIFYVCDLYVRFPLLCINILWMLHVDITFYVISLAQDSTWLIDPYWTLAPPLLVWFWASHPLSQPGSPRQLISCALLLIWAVRLTHSYFRREGWIAGVREDWRYADMKQRFGKWWPAVQVLAVYFVQHCMLVGLTLPWMPIFFSELRWNLYDVVACILCVLGLAVAAHADNALHLFVMSGRSDGSLVLRDGLWAISRHPNHLGEQLWWWGIAMFGVASGSPWTAIGAAFNSLCMWQIMLLVEARMCSKVQRSQQYRRYQKEVAFCIPWCNRHPKSYSPPSPIDE
eukprot:jgi/Ulvmu1/10201/UM060_0001.1